MSSPNNNNSPRRGELQGPRPAPLKIRKDSHKIKKPPIAPGPLQQPPLPPPRQPVIIYTVSPKVIHTDPGEFMKLVQRLTGSSSSSSSSEQQQLGLSFHQQQKDDGAVSPAARFASVEKSRPQEQYGIRKQQENHVMGLNGIDDMFTGIERGFPGILSPGPSSLRPVPSNFFLPSDPSPSLYLPSDPSPSFFHDLSPLLRTNRSFMPLPSPSNFVSPHLSSPTLPLDFFNNLLDF